MYAERLNCNRTTEYLVKPVSNLVDQPAGIRICHVLHVRDQRAVGTTREIGHPFLGTKMSLDKATKNQTPYTGFSLSPPYCKSFSNCWNSEYDTAADQDAV